MLNLISASSLIYAAAIYAAFLLVQSIARNNQLQYAVVTCKTRLNTNSRLN